MTCETECPKVCLPPPKYKHKCPIPYLAFLIPYLPLLAIQIVFLVFFYFFVHYNEKNTREIIGFEQIHVMIFVGFGYLMSYMKHYSFIGIGFNFLLAALVMQWALIVQQLCKFYLSNDLNIYINRQIFVEAEMLSVTALITFGAILGYVSLPQIIFIAAVEILFAAVNHYIFFTIMQAVDIGGGIYIHVFGAFFSLALCYTITKWPRLYARNELNKRVDAKETSRYFSDTTAMLGSLFLWVFWPFFNSSLALSQAESERAFINTYLSLMACTVAVFVLSSFYSPIPGKFVMTHIRFATLAGGVVMGAIANLYIYPGYAMLFGFCAGVLSVCGFRFFTPRFRRCGIRDTSGVFNVHGLPAVMSGLLSVYYASVADATLYGSDLMLIYPGRQKDSDFPLIYTPVRYDYYYVTLPDKYYNETSPTYMYEMGRNADHQGMFQMLALVATIGIALVTGFFTGLFAGWLFPLKYNCYYDDKHYWDIPK